jgi:gliding motility-associated protein GldM
MGGGKETPRQKMVGLMYLVLLALLAMNVSKAVLDAFVSIEKNLQVAAITQLDRGNAGESDLISELADKSNPAKAQKIKYYLTVIDKINKITAERVQEFDAIKMDILVKSAEILTPKFEDEHTVIWTAADPKKPLVPAVINLMAINAKDQYDVPMHTIIGEDLEPVTGSGKEMWANYNKFRAEICDLLGTYAPPGGKKFTFVSDKKGINEFANNMELAKKVDKMMEANAKTANLQDDGEVIKTLYMSLSKNEYADMGEEKHLHWVARTFDHAPLVAALASLTALQQEVLAARATAISHIKSRVSTGEYSFNKVIGLAYGDALVNQGEEAHVGVMMAAFDSDNQPEVKLTKGSGAITVADGKGDIIVKASAGAEMVLEGTVSIKKKSGETKTEKWTHTIKIMKPQGTVSLPEMNMLYRGYKNKVECVASGYPECKPVGTGITLAKSGTSYIGSPGAGRECSITVMGVNEATKKSVSLGKFSFRVQNLPPPQVYLGTLESGATVSKTAVANMPRLFAKYPPSIPLSASFEVSSYEITVSGAPRSISGQGGTLSPEAMSLLKQAKPGAKISIAAKYKGSGYAGNMASIINVQ